MHLSFDIICIACHKPGPFAPPAVNPFAVPAEDLKVALTSDARPLQQNAAHSDLSAAGLTAILERFFGGTWMDTELPAREIAIGRAAAMLGGVGALAERLKVSERQLDYWMSGIGTPPDTVFFDVIEIIIEQAGKAAPERPAYRSAA
jgi:hypothetical protein